MKSMVRRPYVEAKEEQTEGRQEGSSKRLHNTPMLPADVGASASNALPGFENRNRLRKR